LHIVVYTWWCWHICKGEIVIEKNKKGEDQGDRILARESGSLPKLPGVDRTLARVANRTLS
jgi:hypothetical protein